MRQKILILSLISLLFSLAALGIIGITYGWFGHVVTIPEGEIAVGDLRFTKSGAFRTGADVIVPGEELIATSLDVDNASPITSQLRVEVTYTKCVNTGTVVCTDETTYTDAVDEHLSVTFGSGFFYISGYWYYSGDTSRTTYEITADSGPMTIISSLFYDGAYAGIDYFGQTVTVTVTIQVKQADNVDWATLTGYDFTTGYPA
ncbi:MAG: hypothetical protein V1761_00195 [bacterium]